MGRIGETVRRTIQLAHVMKAWRRSEASSGVAGLPDDPGLADPDDRDDTARVLRYLAKVTLEPAITHGIADHVGSLRPGRLADIVLWAPGFFGVKPEWVFKGGFPAWGPLGEGNATVERAEPTRYRPDWAGVSTLSAGLFLAVYAVLRGNDLGWTSSTVLGGLAGGAVLLAAFVGVERHRPRPMLDLGLFSNRTFTGASLVIALLAGGALGAFAYVMLFLLDAQGRDPVVAGLVVSPLAIVSFVVSALAGRVSERLPLRPALVAGMAITTAGTLLLREGIDGGASWLALLPGLAVTGAGVGLANPLATFAHLGVLPPAQGGLASALNNTARQLGLAVGIAVLGALLDATLRDGGNSPAAFADGLSELLLIAALMSAAGAVAALALIRQADMWVPAPA